MLCPICNKNAFKSVWQFNNVSNGCCSSCGHVYSIISGYQEDDYKTFEQKYPNEFLLDEKNEIFSIAQSRYSFVPALRGRVLEIGCGYGHFLHLLKKSGLEVYGIEPSHNQSDFAKKHFGLQVESAIYGRASEECFDKQELYDLVAAFHVLEHISDVRSFLSSIYDDLNHGGYFMLAVPDLETLPADFMELYFIARGWHRHTFQKSHILWLLKSAGFEVKVAIDEQPTIMSPSSMLVVCQKSERPSSLEPVPLCGCKGIEKFHRKLDGLRLTISEAINRWVSENRKIAIYGGGLHTEAVLLLSDLGHNEIVCIIDDDNQKQGGSISGVPIVSADGEQARGCDVVVVSSLVSEKNLVPRLRDDWKDKMIVGFYSDLIKHGTANDG